MLQSMFSGIAGLRAHQRRMDVIGNDIANVNTPGYKQSDVSFKEAYVTTIKSPAPGSPGQSVGLGSEVGGIVRNFTDGILMETGQPANIGISGNGFFVVADPAGGGNKYFSRAGDFMTDTDPTVAAGDNTYLISPSGKRLQGVMAPNLGAAVPGWPADANGLTDITLPENTTSFTVASDGTLYVSVSGAPEEAYGRVALASFDNNTGLASMGNNLYSATPAAGLRAFADPGSDGLGQLFQGYVENSNVNLAQEFTDMIITQRGFQANSRSITTSDEMLMELLSLKR